MKQNISDEDHEHCPTCNPDNFVVEVDLYFLKMVKDHYDTLNRIRPNYYTTSFHGEQINKKIKEAIEKYNKKHGLSEVGE